MTLWQMPVHSSRNFQVMTLPLQDLDGLVAVPSLSHPHFMEAHYLATQVGALKMVSMAMAMVQSQDNKKNATLVIISVGRSSSLGLFFFEPST